MFIQIEIPGLVLCFMKWKYKKFGVLFEGSKENRETWDRYFSNPPFPLHIWWKVLEIVRRYYSWGDYGETLTRSVDGFGRVRCSYSGLSSYIIEVSFKGRWSRKDKDEVRIFYWTGKNSADYLIFYEVEI